MSSSYRILCLSHDPAVVAADGDASGDWNRPEPAESAITAGIDGHEHCDLMITRYSGALVELGCPQSHPKRDGQAGKCLHRSTQWASIAWIRLLLVAQREPAGTVVRGMADVAGVRCWTPTRMERLRAELGIEDPAERTVERCGHPGHPVDSCQPCTLPLGHDWHRDGDGCSWPATASKPQPTPCDAEHACCTRNTTKET